MLAGTFAAHLDIGGLGVDRRVSAIVRNILLASLLLAGGNGSSHNGLDANHGNDHRLSDLPASSVLAFGFVPRPLRCQC
jgi:hypothetical protein